MCPNPRLTAVLIRTLTLMFAVGLTAQTGDVRTQMAAVLRYAGIAQPAATDVAQMAELWARAQQPGLAREERRLAFRDLYLLYSKLQGRDLTARPQALDALSQFVVANFDGGGRMDLSLPEPRGKPSGTYLHVVTRGTGRSPLLLISDLGVDGLKLYDSFIARQSRAYTMHVVTLPFAGAARPLPWPETLDFAARPWLTQIERELLTLVDQPRMKDVTIVGTSGGGYFAARLALLRPRQVRGVVLVNALVHVAQRSVDDPDAPAPLAERLARVRTAPPGPQLFPIAPVPPPDELRRLIADPDSTHPTARNWMASTVKDAALSRAWTFEALSAGFFTNSVEYGWELTVTDLGEGMKDLSVPTLVMGSWHDEASTAPNAPAIAQWEAMKLRYPTIPLTIVTFAETRTYVSADAPAEFDHALADFVARRPVAGKTMSALPRSSPSASVTQTVGDAEIGIAFSRPAVKGAKIWGDTVPGGRVWRAGANEATTFRVSREVRVEGRALAAGTYTF